MVIWGGYTGSAMLNTGGRYHPGSDAWAATTTTGAPAGLALHTAVWTGKELIVWGGTENNSSVAGSGGRYRIVYPLYLPFIAK